MKLTYEPIETQPAPHRPDLATIQRLNCPGCGKTHVATQAVCVAGPMPHTADGANELQAAYQLFCDHCGVVYEWPCICDESGKIAGRVLGTPVRLSGQRFIAKFLAKHPHAAGMEQA